MTNHILNEELDYSCLDANVIFVYAHRRSTRIINASSQYDRTVSKLINPIILSLYALEYVKCYINIKVLFIFLLLVPFHQNQRFKQEAKNQVSDTPVDYHR